MKNKKKRTLIKCNDCTHSLFLNEVSKFYWCGNEYCNRSYLISTFEQLSYSQRGGIK